MAMSVEDVAHPAYIYIDAGITLIPVTPGNKTPLHPWGAYQSRHSTREEIAAWLVERPDCNWAAVCGGGLGCGDLDDPPAAEWALAHPNHPIFQGACLVRSGNGRCHIWFRYVGRLASTKWPMLQGRRAGEIRAEGNYVLVPPSALSGENRRYQRVVGSFTTLPTITDPGHYLESIVQTYLQENPGQEGVEPNLSSKQILTLNAMQKASIEQRVRQEGFKKKITDTLFVDGHQTPRQGHWERVDSNSEIDFAVCCEFIRKKWAFEDVEEVFASTYVGQACYRNTDRKGAYGQGYLARTYANAKKQVDLEDAAARQAQGANFKVIQADLLDTGDDKHYTLVLLDTQDRRYTVRVTSKQLRSETLFCDACAAQARFFPRFNANQLGRAFSLFAEAVDGTVVEVRRPPSILTEVGRVADAIADRIRYIPIWTEMPATRGAAHGLGWRMGDTYWIRLTPLLNALDNAKMTRRGDGPLVGRALASLGEVRMETKVWADSTEEVLRLERLSPGRPGLRALPPSS